MNPFADLRLAETERWRPFAVVAPEFAHTVAPGEAPAGGPVAPYAAVEVDLGDVTGTVSCGLTDLRAVYDAARGRVRIEVAGRVVRHRRRRLAAGSTLGFALCENQVTVLAREPGAAWRPLLTERERVRAVLALRDPAVLATQRWAWSADVPGAVRAVRHGPFGMAGLRDPHLVAHADGTPYRRDGRVFLTWTCAGLGGFAQAHWGVFALDPARPRAMEQVAQLWFRRGGRVLGDHAGQLVRDGDRWHVAVSSWGDFTPERGVHARVTTTDADLLRGEHVLETEPLVLPTTLSTWDPSLQRDGDGWLVAYVESPSVAPFRFRPALARTRDDVPWRGLQLVGPSPDLRACEGPVLVRRDGATWVVASDETTRTFPVFDTVTFAPAGALPAAYPTNIPHPQLLRDADGSWLMLTFDGTRLEPRRRESGRRPVLGYGTHGDVVVQRARPGEGQT